MVSDSEYPTYAVTKDRIKVLLSGNYEQIGKEEIPGCIIQELGYYIPFRDTNAVRPFVVGRKNWLFSDSPKGASASAMLYSLVVSAKMNGLNAEEYFVRLFRSDVPMLPY